MKALILYALFVAAGAVASALIGLFIEREVSSVASLIVFLTLFFANFVVSWVAVVLVMDGSLAGMQGQAEQLQIEREARQHAAERRA
jgi:hypothetical protein